MAHTKSAGAGRFGRDSQPKYLGVKKFDGELVKIGDILVRQRGTRILPGLGVKRGSDDTLYAVKTGTIKFQTRRKNRFDGSLRFVKVINIL